MSAFATFFQNSEHRQSVCVLAVLSWVAQCDGKVTEKEQLLFDKVADATGDTTDADRWKEIEAAISEKRVEDLLLACRYLREHLDRGASRLLAELAITMAVQSGALSVGENHVLQFIADVLGFSPRAFAKLFQRVTRVPFPEAGDPSSILWWQERQAGHAASIPLNSAVVQDPSSDDEIPEGPMARTTALRVLGLDDSASSARVHQAYRRLAKSRHPDRFASLGAAAVATATDSFKRLHEAYAVLCA